MKRIFFGLVLIFLVSTKISAQTTDATSIRYWYYPSQNVYYNETTGDYWFYDRTTTKWIIGKQLAAGYTPIAEGSIRYPIYYTGPDVWKENKNHKVKYKVKKDGTVKTKVKPDQ